MHGYLEKSHGARPVHLIITMIQWIRTSRLSKKTSLAHRGADQVDSEEQGDGQRHAPEELVHEFHTPAVQNNHFTEMCCGTEAGSYLRLIDSFITQIKAQGPSRTCSESKKEEEGNLSTKSAPLRFRV